MRLSLHQQSYSIHSVWPKVMDERPKYEFPATSWWESIRVVWLWTLAVAVLALHPIRTSCYRNEPVAGGKFYVQCRLSSSEMKSNQFDGPCIIQWLRQLFGQHSAPKMTETTMLWAPFYSLRWSKTMRRRKIMRCQFFSSIRFFWLMNFPLTAFDTRLRLTSC